MLAVAVWEPIKPAAAGDQPNSNEMKVRPIWPRIGSDPSDFRRKIGRRIKTTEEMTGFGEK